MARRLYVYERPAWPDWQWEADTLSTKLARVRHQQGRLFGRMQALGFELQAEAILATLTEDVVKSSAIEGEDLDRGQVRSSLARRLGIDIGALDSSARNIDGVVEMMLDATQNYAEPLTIDRLQDWQAALFPGGTSGMSKIIVGAWRDDRAGPMQVVSGAIGRERVHFEAPPAARINAEIKGFLRWFEKKDALDPVLKAALAHLWFVTIHPFDDGNGRVARAIADMQLARSEQSPSRFYSMSSQIRAERTAYYDILETTQKGALDVTAWLAWFVECLERALARAESTLSAVLVKAQFWETFKATNFNPRQQLMINRLLDGFEGKLTSSKWATLTKSSQDSALRDITDLVDRGVLVRDAGGGRSTSYALAPLGSD